MSLVNDDPVLQEDWEAIRRAALRALGEDLALAQHNVMLRLADSDELAAIRRRIELVTTAQFLPLEAP